MAWTAPMTFVTATTITAAQLNTHLRDNLNQTEGAVAMHQGRYLVATGANALAERECKQAELDLFETYTGNGVNNVYGDLATIGPQVTLTTGTRALVMVGVNSRNSVNDNATFTSWSCSGATTLAASDTWAILIDGINAEQAIATSRIFLANVTAGVNTFKTEYRLGATASSIGTWGYRRICVMAF